MSAIQLTDEQLKEFAKQITRDSKREVDQRWLTKKQACAYIGVASQTTFNEKVKSGILPQPSFHLGATSPRWDREAIDRKMNDYFRGF